MNRPALFAALSLCLTPPAFAFDISRVSLDGAGGQISGDSRGASISADGRFLVFTTTADLVPGDANGLEDVYLRDLRRGELTLVSRPYTGPGADRPSSQPAISADGSRVVFTSTARNLVPDDNAGKSDVFLYNRPEDSLVRISRGFDGTEADGSSSSPGLSADGKVVVYQSRATNLVDDDTNGEQDIFFYSLVAGITRRVSITSGGEELTGFSNSPSVAHDGLKVAFASLAPEINPRGRSGLTEVFTHDLVTGETSRARVPPQMMEPSDVFRNPHLSPDGGWVAFTRTRGGGGGLADILLQDLDTGETIQVTQPMGEPQRGFPTIGGIAEHGSMVAFDSTADNLVPGDDNGRKDVFRYGREADALERVSGPAPGAGGNGESRALGIVPDGETVLFVSRASNLVADDTNGGEDIFLADLSVFAIDSAITGSWYDPSQDGHGFNLEYVAGERLVFYWFTFTPGGDREWIFGALEVDGTVAEGQAFRHLGDGARFPPAIDPPAIDAEAWGTVRFEFSDCHSGSVSWSAPPPYGDGDMALTRLTAIPALTCR